MLTKPHRQEALCRAYVQAVAAQAGLSYSVPTPDYGIDLGLWAIEQHGTQYRDTGLQLDLQLRSTTRAHVGDTEVTHDLDVRTYDFLRASPVMCPRLLVVLVLPAEENQWLTQSPEELILRRCAYWLSLTGAEPTTASSSVRVAIPSGQIFSVEGVQAMINRMKQQEVPW